MPDLRQVGRQHGGAAVAGEVACLGIDKNRHVGGLCLGKEGRQQVGRADALVVIGADEAVHVGQDGFDPRQNPGVQLRRQRQAALLIQTYKLLMPGDEARLLRGRTPGVLHQQVVGDALRPQLLPHVPPRHVVPDHPRQAHLATQGAQVGRHVRRAAQHVALNGALENGDWSLGGDAGDVPGQVRLAHDVADNENPCRVPKPGCVRQWVHRFVSILQFYFSCFDQTLHFSTLNSIEIIEINESNNGTTNTETRRDISSGSPNGLIIAFANISGLNFSR